MFGQATATSGSSLLARYVHDAEDAGLADLDEKHRLLVQGGGHGHRQHDLEDAFVDAAASRVELNLDLRRLALEENLGGMRHLDGEVADVEFLDAEDRLFVLFHFLLSVSESVSGGSVEQRLELAGGIEGSKIVEAADMGGADVDLRHGAAPRPLHHLVAPHRVEVNANFLDRADAARRQQLLGALAVGTDGGRIHQDGGGHRSRVPFFTG